MGIKKSLFLLLICLVLAAASFAGGKIYKKPNQTAEIYTQNLKSAITPSNFVTVSNGNFYLNNQKFYLYGMNYAPSYYNTPTFQLPNVNGVPMGFLASPYYENHVNLIEKELEDIRSLGINMLSISTPRRNNPNALVNLKDFIQRVKNYGFKLNLNLLYCDPLYIGREPSELNFDEQYCLNQIRYLNLRDNDTLLSYEIAAEPHLGGEQQRLNIPELQDAWQNWIKEQYGSLENAKTQWGTDDLSQPTDSQMGSDGPWTRKAKAYRQFITDFAVEKWGYMIAKIKEIDPNHLVSGRTGWSAGWTSLSYLHAMAKVGDFVGLEQWNLPFQTYQNYEERFFSGFGFSVAYAKAISGGKPVIFYEWGLDTLADECRIKAKRFAPECYHNNPGSKQQNQRTFFERYYQESIKAGTDGVILWTYVFKRPIKVAPGDAEISDFGIREVPYNDLGEVLGPTKLAYNTVKQYASQFTQNRSNPAYNDTITINPEDHYSESLFLEQGFKLYAQKVSQGKLPRVSIAPVSCNRCSTQNGCQRAIWKNSGNTCDPVQPVGEITRIQDYSCPQISGGNNSMCNGYPNTTQCNQCSQLYGCQKAVWKNIGNSCSPVDSLGSINRIRDCSCPSVGGGNNWMCGGCVECNRDADCPQQQKCQNGTCQNIAAPIPGDANGDGQVNEEDYNIWKDHYGQSGGFSIGDFNGDGVVNGLDYLIWLNHKTG